MRNVQRWFSGAVMAALVKSLLELGFFTAVNGAPAMTFEPQNAVPAPSISDVGIAAPENLTAIATGTSTVALTWTDNSSDEDGFKIERKLAGGSFSKIATVGSNINSFNDAGLSAGAKYMYRIRAFKVSLNSKYAKAATVTTMSLPLMAPGHLTATATGASTIALAWMDNSSDEDGFKIERKISGENFSEIATAGSNVNFFNDTGLSAGTTYVYRVRAYQSASISNYSNEATVAVISGSSTGPTLTIADVSINEGNAGTTDVLAAVTLTNPSGQTVAVDYEVVAGSATAGSDYTVLSTFGTMTFFNGGATTQRVRITIIGDTANEPNEMFFVNLSNAKNATLANSQATGTIINDDGGGGAVPMLAISDVSANEGNAGTADVFVAVTLTNPNGQTVTVDYQVVDGSAASGSDYTVLSSSGTMTFFNGGATTQRVRVTIIGDTANEPDETFFVNLSNATNATLTDNQGVGTIINDDGIILPPVPPNNLTANATGASTAALAWMDISSDEDGFKIERKISGGNFSEIITVGSSITSFNDTGLNACTTYIYRVRAFKGTVNSGFSNEASATTTGCASPPTLAIAEVSTDEGDAGTTDVLVAVTLTDPNSQTVTVDYQVVDGSATAGSDYTVLSTSGTMTFFNGGATTQRIRITIIGDVTNEPDETFFVNLSNATNATLADDQAVGTIINDDGAVTPPNAPSNLTAAAIGAMVNLTWTDNSTDESSFEIQLKIGTGAFSIVGTASANIASASVAGPGNVETHTYRVRACNGSSCSDYSNEASPIFSPDNLTATAAGASTITLAWTDNSSSELGFKIERKTGAGAFSTIATVNANETSFNDAGLNACTLYIYRVRAYKLSTTGFIEIEIYSSYSNEASATTTGCGISPTLSISGVSTYEGNSGTADVLVAVTLTNPNSQTVTVDYQVIDGSAAAGSDYTVLSTSGTMTFFNGGATTQRIRVTIIGDAADEPDETFFVNLSNAANATLTDNQSVGTIINDDGLTPPAAPSNLSATATGTTTTSLVWTDNSSDEDGFKIERKLSGGNFSEIMTVGSNVNFFDDVGLSAGTTYVYRVRAFKAALNSNYSNEATVTTLIGGTTNLALNKPVAASSIYAPRPVTNAIDGDTDTYWRSGTINNASPPTWLRVDLGTAMAVGKVVVKWRDNYYAKNYEAQVSNDDVNWTTVSAATGAAGAQTLNFSQRTARYVRVNLLLNQKSNYRVEELEVYSGTVTKPHEAAAAAASLPDELVLEQNYPNPFNPSTRIGFRLPSRLAGERVTIKVYTVNGAEVKTLVDEQYPAGAHSVVFTPKNLPSGTYFYVMQAGTVRQVRRLMLVK
jgi:titin